MPTEEKPKTGKLNGRLWGTRARDWAELQEPMTRPLYNVVFERVGVGAQTSYLDVGCGSGLAAHLAAERGAKVSAVDAAENLLAIAQSRVPAGQFRVADLEELPFPDKTFDLVTGFNSFQYAANPDAALAEAKRVAKSGSTVVIVTWGKPEGMQAATLMGALKALVPPPPPGTPGPFALSDEHALREFATKADLEPVEIVDVDSPFHYTDLSTATWLSVVRKRDPRGRTFQRRRRAESIYRSARTISSTRWQLPDRRCLSLSVYSSLKVGFRDVQRAGCIKK